MAKEKAAGIFLVNKENKILVGHPTNHRPDFWSIPKGKIDGDETPLQAAIRETYEESNVKLFPDLHEFVELGRYIYRHKKKDIVFFAHFETKTAEWSKTISIRCNSNVPEEKGGFPEMDDFKWVTIDEAREILHETQVAALIKLELEIVEFRRGESGEYSKLWCSSCNKFTFHRVKLSASLEGYRVCNKCSKMNPVCELIKLDNGVNTTQVYTSNTVKFVDYNEDNTYKDIHDEPSIGMSCLMGPTITIYKWITSPIAEIYERLENGNRVSIRFKTQNSFYELNYHKI